MVVFYNNYNNYDIQQRDSLQCCRSLPMLHLKMSKMQFGVDSITLCSFKIYDLPITVSYKFPINEPTTKLKSENFVKKIEIHWILVSM